MWTRGKDKNDPSKFAYSLYSDMGAHVETVGGFLTHTAAERAAEVAQRNVLNIGRADSARRYFDAIAADIDMTDDQLLDELFGDQMP